MKAAQRSGSSSPARSSQSNTVSHLLASSLMTKGVKNMTPITPKDASSMATSNVMTVVVDSVRVKTSEVKMGTNELYIKICSGKDTRMLLQKGQSLKDGFSIYNIDEHALFVPGTAKKVNLSVEVFITGDESVAKGSITFDADTLLMSSGTEGGKWESIALKAQIDRSNKNLKLMHVVGEVRVNVEMKPEAYWSDSESDNSTATNSVSTTPGSVVSMHAGKLLGYLNGSNSGSKSTTVTSKGNASTVTFTSPKSASSVADKENADSASNIKSGGEPAEKKGASAIKPSPSAGVLKSALKVSSNSSTFSYSKTNFASASKNVSTTSLDTPGKEKKKVSLSAKSPTPEKAKGKRSSSAAEIERKALSVGLVHVIIAAAVGLAFVASLFLYPYLATNSTHLHLPSPVRNWEGTQLVIYNPSKRVLLVDETDGACMSWRRGPLGGHATFSHRSCSSTSTYWSIRKAPHASFLQLEHDNGKCLCPKSEFRRNSALVMKACDACSSGWSLDPKGGMHGGKLGATLSRKTGMLGKSRALLTSRGNTHMAAYTPSREGSHSTLKKYSSF